MHSSKRKVDGYEFVFSVTMGQLDGVVVPFDADLTRPGYVAALAKAVNAWRYVSWEISVIDNARHAMRHFDDDQLRWWIEKADQLLTQQDIEVDPRVEEAAQMWRDELLQREERYAREARKVRRPRKPKGFVYVVQSPTGHYKIGRTADPANRLRTFGIQLPFEVEYACLIQADDAYELEAQLHERYAAKRVNGEWFNLAPEDVEYIRGLAS